MGNVENTPRICHLISNKFGHRLDKIGHRLDIDWTIGHRFGQLNIDLNKTGHKLDMIGHRLDKIREGWDQNKTSIGPSARSIKIRTIQIGFRSDIGEAVQMLPPTADTLRIWFPANHLPVTLLARLIKKLPSSFLSKKYFCEATN
jgi:hypothetical protein